MVSVIIPVYNGAEFLEDCLRSVMGQSYRNIEIIVVDDGSTDDTYIIGKALAEEDSRIRIVQQENGGVSVARNKAMTIATGEYIAFVDADDFLTEKAIEAMVAIAKTGADMVIGSYEEFRGNSRKAVIRKETEYTYETAKNYLSEFNKLIQFPWGRLYRRSVLVEHAVSFDRSIPYGEDHIFNLHYCRHANRIVVCKNLVYRYRLGGLASSVKYYPDKCRLSLALLEAYCVFCGGRDNVPDAFWKKAVRDGFVGSVTHYLVHCKMNEAAQKTRESLAFYAPYLNEDTVNVDNYSSKLARYVLKADVKQILRQIYREQFASIAKKKMKKLYYKFFTKRI